MSRPLLLTLCLCLTTACEDPEEPDCLPVVMTTASGEIDDCDLQACEAAYSGCTEAPMVLESYPPQYVCGDQGPYDVYDFCPDWGADTGSGD